MNDRSRVEAMPLLRILAISHLFPHPANPQQGVFAARQFAGIQKCGAEVVVFYPVLQLPRLLGMIHPRWRDYASGHMPLASYGLKVVCVPWYRLTRGMGSCRWDGIMVYLAMKKQALKLHSEKPFDVILGRGLFPGADAAARLGRRLRIPSAGVAIGGDANLAPRHSAMMQRHFVRVLKQVDALFANGQGVSDAVSQASGRPCQTAHGVVDLDVFQPVAAKEPLRRELGLPVDAIIMLYAGNLIREKGLYELLDAFERVLPKSTDALLVMCGRGTEEERLRVRVDAKGLGASIRLVGQIKPEVMPQWMQASDLFVLPSYHEGMPNAVMEAMACGLPVISTKVGGLPAAVGDSPGAVLVEPRSVSDLADAMLQLCLDPSLRQQMSAATRETAVARFGINRNAEKIIEHLSRLRNAGRGVSSL